MSVWRPESFSNFHERLKADPEGASNALDLSVQVMSKQIRESLDGVTALQPTGSITKNRPTNVPLYYVYFDTTLGKPIWFTGKGIWVDSTGTPV
jgi:hypothetical protein